MIFRITKHLILRAAVLGAMLAAAAGLTACSSVRAAAPEAYQTLQALSPAPTSVPTVAERISYRIGDELPELSDFLEDWDGDAALVTDLSEIDWNLPGTVSVELTAGGEAFVSDVEILDADAPELTLLACAAEPGQALAPEDFLFLCDDISPVEFSFAEKPDTSETGTYAVTVVATDAYGNSAEATTELYVCERVVHLEAGPDPIPQWQLMNQFGREYANCWLPFRSDYYPNRLGAEAIALQSWYGERVVGIQIRDTLPPQTAGWDVTCYTGYSFPPERFVPDLKDGTEVTGRFVEEPDWNTVGPAEVSLVFTDALGHSTEVTVHADFVRDDIPPVIYGAEDRYCYVGEPVSYFDTVFAEDNADPDVILTVDKSRVKYWEEGVCPVTYTATDGEGNSSSKTIRLTFVQQAVTDEAMDEMAEEIFAEIFTDGMSVCEQAEAIFHYLRAQMYYVGYSDKSDWKANVYKGIHEGRGDCYTFCAASDFLLQKIGVKTVWVQRLNGHNRHFWLLADLGTGWYHFDPTLNAPDHYQAFMKTTQELIDAGGGEYWNFDAHLYPEVETTPFVPF